MTLELVNLGALLSLLGVGLRIAYRVGRLAEKFDHVVDEVADHGSRIDALERNKPVPPPRIFEPAH